MSSKAPGLEAMGISLWAGRGFTARDTRSSEPVALVNETLARTLWPGQNAMGQILMAEGPRGPERRVVGIVGDVRHWPWNWIPVASGTCLFDKAGNPAHST